MRLLSVIVLLSSFLSLPTYAAGIQIICPPLVREGIVDFAAAYTRQTGTVVTVKSDVMGKIMDDITRGPIDVVLLPSNLMDRLAKNGGIISGTRQDLGRVQIALAVRLGAPRPDISTVAKLRDALEKAKTVAYTQPGPPRNSMEAAIIDGIMRRPEFARVHTMTVVSGSGISALASGDADIALQVTPEIISRKDVKMVGPLPQDLGAHIDAWAAVSARSSDLTAALDFVRYITRPQATQVWKEFGLDR